MGGLCPRSPQAPPRPIRQSAWGRGRESTLKGSSDSGNCPGLEAGPGVAELGRLRQTLPEGSSPARPAAFPSPDPGGGPSHRISCPAPRLIAPHLRAALPQSPSPGPHPSRPAPLISVLSSQVTHTGCEGSGRKDLPEIGLQSGGQLCPIAPLEPKNSHSCPGAAGGPLRDGRTEGKKPAWTRRP